MTTPTDESTLDPLAERWGERISAYVDGELAAEDAAEVADQIERDPTVRALAEGLRGVSAACHAAPAPAVGGDLTASVLAEARRRQAAGDDGRVATEDTLAADRLEPEGDFGLPFGRGSSRNWVWGGVAAAAALMISFYGRPGQPGPVAPTPLDRGLAVVRQAAPNLAVKNVTLTPNQLAALQRRFAMPSAGRAKLPAELMTVSQRGVELRPVDPSAVSEEGERLVYVDAGPDEVDRLLARLGERDAVEAPQSAEALPTPQAVRLQLQLKPGAKLQVKLPPGSAIQPGGVTADGKQRVLLRIRVIRAPTP
ncbi:MAG: hypothetical protein AAF805_14595 [Planctomycetota bacterium]